MDWVVEEVDRSHQGDGGGSGGMMAPLPEHTPPPCCWLLDGAGAEAPPLGGSVSIGALLWHWSC